MVFLNKKKLTIYSCGILVFICFFIVLAYFICLSNDDWRANLIREKTIVISSYFGIDEEGFMTALNEEEKKELVSLLNKSNMESHKDALRIAADYTISYSNYKIEYAPKVDLRIIKNGECHEYYLTEEADTELQRLCMKIAQRSKECNE